MGFLLGRITWWMNVIYESRMKWTWHNSKFAIHEVSFSFNYYLHDGTIGMRDLDVMLLCTGHMEGWEISCGKNYMYTRYSSDIHVYYVVWTP